ncbi:hypothetical protein Tsubulata_037077, partial [Turnera subulata]
MVKFATIVLLILMVHVSSKHAIRDEFIRLVSDGMDLQNNGNSKEEILQHGNLTITVTCEPQYGFLPCTTVNWGQDLFLMVVYQYLLALAEKYISDGSDIFFEMFGTGIFGAGLFQIMGIFPQMFLILATGFSAAEDTAVGSMAAMAMGILAGTTIMCLTVTWSSVVALGSYNVSEDSTTSHLESSKPFNLKYYGVSTDMETKNTAKIMMLSLIPFLLLLLSKPISSTFATRIVVLISLMVTVLFLLAYCTYQVFQPWMQKRRLAYLMRQHLRNKLLPALCNPDGTPNVAKISKLFNELDRNKDSQISADELRSLIVGIHIEEIGLNEDDVVSHVMEGFDANGDSNLSKDEFVQGLSSWLSKANDHSTRNQVQNEKEANHNNSKGSSEEEQTKTLSKKCADNKSAWWNYTKASFLILLGTAITVLLASSFLQSVQAFANAVNIPSFLVSYCLIPLALGFRQTFKAIVSATEKTKESVSLTLSQIYGGVFMNNIMGLVIFLSLVYVRNISWDVSAEILA